MALSNHLNFTWLPLDALKPLGRKARTHSRQQLASLVESIRAFGFSVPILIDDHNRILAGNARLEAARQAGLDKVPVVTLSHLDDKQKRAFVLAENRLAELAGWDREILKVELQELASLDLGFDLSIIGFDEIEIEALTLGDAPSSDIAESAPAPPSQPTSRPGDLWLMDDHRLVCGDALSPVALAGLLAGAQARAVFTDPPYNLSIQRDVTKSGLHSEFAMASGEMNRAEFADFLDRVWRQIEGALAPGGLAYVCMDWRHAPELLASLEGKALEQLNLIVWDKTCGGMGSFYRSRHELIFLVRKQGGEHLNRVQLGRHGRDRTNVWSYRGLSGGGEENARLRELHPTVKPLAMVKDALLDCTRKGDVVLDLFSGSGTTLLAAHATGRPGRAIEIDPAYVDVGVVRWQDFAGREAVLAETSETYREVKARRRAEAAEP